MDEGHDVVSVLSVIDGTIRALGFFLKMHFGEFNSPERRKNETPKNPTYSYDMMLFECEVG